MSAFDDTQYSFEHFSGKARLFPLPNLVLFPHVMQPLHIFERRYRDLLEDALAGDRLIAMTVLMPGWEKNYEGRPPVYPMACLGRITTHCRLADGTYNVLLLGLRRIRLLRELPSTREFREAEVELCKDVYSAYSLARQRALRDDLRDALLQLLPNLPEAREQLDHLLQDDVPLGMLTDVIGYVLDIGMTSKQLLLSESDVYRRAEILLSRLSEVATTVSSATSTFGFPPEFSAN
jgi:uncharacterized protein